MASRGCFEVERMTNRALYATLEAQIMRAQTSIRTPGNRALVEAQLTSALELARELRMRGTQLALFGDQARLVYEPTD